MTFPSKIDWWVALILIAASLLDLGIGGVMLYEAIVQAAPLPVLLAGFIPVLVAVLLLWIYTSTGCVISPPNVIVHCGPMWFTIPLDAIAEVQQKSTFSFELGWNFALSQDRLFIKYRKPNGRVALFGVAVSPQDKEGFLEELARQVPGLKVENVGDQGPKSPDGVSR